MPVTESNCVAGRRGGEQQEVKDQSVVKKQSELDSAKRGDEPANEWRSPNRGTGDGQAERARKAVTVKRGVVGDGMIKKDVCIKQGDLSGEPTGVHVQDTEEPA